MSSSSCFISGLAVPWTSLFKSGFQYYSIAVHDAVSIFSFTTFIIFEVDAILQQDEAQSSYSLNLGQLADRCVETRFERSRRTDNECSHNNLHMKSRSDSQY